MRNKIIIATACIVCVAIVGGVNAPSRGGSVQHVAASPDTSDASVVGLAELRRIANTYCNNEIRFKRDYAGRKFEAVMPFNNASKQLFGLLPGYMLTFGPGGMSGGNVVCSIDDEPTIQRVIEWNKGRKAVIRGSIRDVNFMGDLHLGADCTTIEVANHAPRRYAPSR
jgi:hypothetical protein